VSPPLRYVGAPAHRPLGFLRTLLDRSDEALLAVAYVRKAGVGLIEREVRALRRRGGTLRVLTTFDFGLTQPVALEALMDEGAEVKTARFADRAYHPKIYLGRGTSGARALVGSANLTAAGLVRNVEGGVAACGSEAATIHDEAWPALDELWASAPHCPRGIVIPPQPRAPRRIPDLGLPELHLPSITPGVLRDSRAVPSDDEEFDGVWAELLRLAVPGAVFHTATGQPNTVIAAGEDGVVLATESSPAGELVPRDMFERVVAGVAAVGELPLNAPKGSGRLDATRELRVYRSSAVFALLGALDRYRLAAKPRVMLSRRSDTDL